MARVIVQVTRDGEVRIYKTGSVQIILLDHKTVVRNPEKQMPFEEFESNWQGLKDRHRLLMGHKE